jgi:hypothetical protein
LDEPFFMNDFVCGVLDLLLRITFPPWSSLFS